MTPAKRPGTAPSTLGKATSSAAIDGRGALSLLGAPSKLLTQLQDARRNENNIRIDVCAETGEARTLPARESAEATAEALERDRNFLWLVFQVRHVHAWHCISCGSSSRSVMCMHGTRAHMARLPGPSCACMACAHAMACTRVHMAQSSRPMWRARHLDVHAWHAHVRTWLSPPGVRPEGHYA